MGSRPDINEHYLDVLDRISARSINATIDEVITIIEGLSELSVIISSSLAVDIQDTFRVLLAYVDNVPMLTTDIELLRYENETKGQRDWIMDHLDESTRVLMREGGLPPSHVQVIRYLLELVVLIKSDTVVAVSEVLRTTTGIRNEYNT